MLDIYNLRFDQIHWLLTQITPQGNIMR